MNPSINASQHITTLRQSHRTATTLLPVLTAGLTVAGAVLAAMEARSSHAESESPSAAAAPLGDTQSAAQSGPLAAMQARGRRLTLRRYIATLLGRMLLVALGVALVLGLVYAASASGRTGQAVLLTVLVLLVFYLTEKVARRACACS